MSSTPSSATAPAQLRVEATYPSPGTIRVVVAGEVDLATAQALHDALHDALSAGSPEVLDIDLAGLTFIDCTGLGVLIEAKRVAAGRGCRVRLANPRPVVRRLLEMSSRLDPAGHALLSR